MTQDRHHKCVCIDSTNGIYLVKRQLSGPMYACHVVKKTTGNVKISCSVQECRQAMGCAARSSMPGFECAHIESTKFADRQRHVQANLSEHLLEDLCSDKILKRETVISCLKVARDAQERSIPLIGTFSSSTIDRHIPLSVYTPSTHSYSTFGRVVVTFDKETGKFSCACCTRNRGCIHKAISVWFLHQDYPDLVTTHTEATNQEEDDHEDTCEQIPGETSPSATYSLYPPKDHSQLSSIINYISTHKRVPADVPKDIIFTNPSHLEEICPTETNCPYCEDHPALEEPTLINRNGKILDLNGMYDGIPVYCKFCSVCNIPVRYQEFCHGIHNFDDNMFLSLKLCTWLRHSLANHVPIGTVLSTLQVMLDVQFNHTTVMNGYLHYETLVEHNFSFTCSICGIYPPVLIFDLTRKAVFNVSVSDLDSDGRVLQESKNNDRVDMFAFWKQAEEEILERGFSRGSKTTNPVVPSYRPWAPWIAPDVLKSTSVYNTEYRKARKRDTPNDESKAIHHHLSKEKLEELLEDAKVLDIQEFCRKCGVPDKGSKMDMVGKLRDILLKDRTQFDKVFSKIWGASGGHLTVCCPHLVSYAVKFPLRAEGPRDYMDILLSMKYPPTVTICDIPHMVSAHGNKRHPAFFRPHQGRLCEATEDAITSAEEGDLTVTFPWFRDIDNAFHGIADQNEEDFRHPVTGQFNRYCLYDRLHETNTKQRPEILRRLVFVPEMHGILNSQAAEQIHATIKRDLRFLNNMGPTTHLITTRLTTHIRNVNINNATTRRLEREMGNKTSLDYTGRLVLDLSQSQLQSCPDADKHCLTSSSSRSSGLTVSEERGIHGPKPKTSSSSRSSGLTVSEERGIHGPIRKPKGLSNPDNRCYANAAIQCLLASSFEDYIVDLHPDEQGNRSAFRQWLAQFMTSNRRLGCSETVDTTELIYNIREEFLFLRSSRQHDGFEFIDLLMEPMKDYWAIECTVSIECVNCLNKSQTTDRVPNLVLTTSSSDSPVLTISELLGLHLVAEPCFWHDLPCQVKDHEGYIEREITSGGTLLVIALGRYDEDRVKDHRRVQVEEHLSLAADLNYRLAAVMCHHSIAMETGHYTAWTHREGRWFKCDDETVTEQDSIINDDTVATSCYVFFYIKNSNGITKSTPKCSESQSTKSPLQGFMLSPEENRKVDKAFSTECDDDVVAELNKIKVRCKDIKTLDGNGWLNDIVIDVFMQAACISCSGSTPVRSVSVHDLTQWRGELKSGSPLSKRCLQENKDFSKMNKILIPFNVLGNHWCLLVIDLIKMTIRCYDSWSRNAVHIDVVAEARGYFSKRDAQLARNDFPGINDWPIEQVTCPLQLDTSSCGAFVCLYTMQECGLAPAMDTVNTRDLRRYIACKVLENKPSSGGVTKSAGDGTEVEAFDTWTQDSQDPPSLTIMTDLERDVVESSSDVKGVTMSQRQPETKDSSDGEDANLTLQNKLHRKSQDNSDKEDSFERLSYQPFSKRKWKRIIVQESSEDEAVPTLPRGGKVTTDGKHKSIKMEVAGEPVAETMHLSIKGDDQNKMQGANEAWEEMILCGKPVLLLGSPDTDIEIKTPKGVQKVYKKK
ncbi:uncharacterized protein [Branchiostoma lanceolatum]|uniref:uncharacterized protein n=1 Tax=Branchiostoma lanceolatum TaxID=7740 RepID=UPI0034534D4B